MPDRYDICIVGGGMVGACLALALRSAPARILLIESQPRRPAGTQSDQRGLALSLATQRILDHAGVWARISGHAAPIRRVHVSEQGRFGCARFDAGMLGLDAIGYVVNGGLLGETLMEAVRNLSGVEVRQPARVTRVDPGTDSAGVQLEGGAQIHCRLLVAADGTASPVRRMLGIPAREHDFRQAALVAVATPRAPHEDTAFERFSTQGPLAVLPMQDGRCSIVYCIARERLDEHLALDDAAFLERLDDRFGGRLDGFTAVSPRTSHPLMLVEPEEQVSGRVLFLGNSAHTLHPNAAQGLNLGARDAAGLAELLGPALSGGGDPGAAALLAAYVEARSGDQRRVLRFTEGLARMYYDGHPGKMLARSACMHLVERIPPLKRAVLRMGAGLHGRQPAWVRGAAAP